MKINHLFGQVALFLATAMGCGASAVAAPMTLNFSGTVTQIQFDPFDPLAGAVGPGTGLYSYLNFDSDAVDAAPSANLGSYTLSGGTFGFAAVLGGVVFPVMRTVNISVLDGIGGAPDQYTVFASEGTPGGLNDYFTLSILLQDDSGTAIDGDGLPPGLPALTRFGARSFALAGQYTDMNGEFLQYEVLGVVTPIPTPGTPSLMAAALLASLAAIRRTRGCHNHKEIST